jgi:hypothetical protein
MLVHLEAVPSRASTDFKHAFSSKTGNVLEFMNDIGDRWVYLSRIFACPELIPDRA